MVTPSSLGYRDELDGDTTLNEVAAPQAQGTLTILFTDLEGSTDLRVRVGDTVANEVIRLHDELTRSLLQQSGAIESKALGDGFMGLFSSANKAIEAAVAIQRAIEEHNNAKPDAPISVRMGLHSGDVTRSEGDAHGTAVHAAARVMSKAQGGQILASQLVHDLAGSLTETRIVDRGLFWLKGFPDRWRLFEVLWRDRDDGAGRATREVRAASAAAFDLDQPRSIGPVVGREMEQRTIRDHLEAIPSAGLRAVVLEGEAGIGKTRMLEAASDMASGSESPFWVLDVTADEELRGPFLLFRSLLTSPRMAAIAKEAMSLEQLERAQRAIATGSGQEAGLQPQEQMLRTYDEVTSSIAALTRERPIALMFDDLQWADEDSIQLIRYLVRTLASAPLFLLINIRPHSDSAAGGAGKLIADLDRMKVTTVLRLHRLTRLQTGELLQNLLGAPVDDATLQSLHSRSEGVPFFIEELARAYREADALQLMDGTWRMTKLSGPTIPSSIQSLVERRLAQLTDDSRSLLSDAGVLGRRFRLADLSAVLAKIKREDPVPEWQLAEDLQKAVDLGLIVEMPEASGYDFSFSHDQIRESLMGSASRQRKRAVHGAVAEILSAQAADSDLSMLTYHALKSGDSALAIPSAVRAAERAVRLSAPEEAIRLIDAALTAASEPKDRIELLRIKDGALAVLDRGMDRMANLSEMAALTGAVDSPGLDADVKLRRAAAARDIADYELAADLATAVRKSAEAAGDLKLELAACLELGQAITHCPLGEGYLPLVEIDLDAAEEPFQRALEIAREIGARSEEAAALRELAVIEFGRVKLTAIAAVGEGATRLEILQRGPELFTKAKELAEQAFHIYEELGDRRGTMSALISMAYAHITDPTAKGMAGRIEHIRTLHHSRETEVTESQRAIDDAHMLYSIHAYARDNAQPDLALERGRQAFEAARGIGDRWLECLTAGGTAMAYLGIGSPHEAAAWIDRAANAAMAIPSPSLARRLEMWRAALAASEGDVSKMVGHYERAAELAGQRNLAGRAAAFANLAISGAHLLVEGGDDSLIETTRQAADKTLETIRPMAGPLPWEYVAQAALAIVAQAEGRSEDAAEHARSALGIDGETHITEYLHVLWAAGRTLIAQGVPEAAALTAQIFGGFTFVNMSIGDSEIKAKWFAMPAHKELAEIVGFDPHQAWDGLGGEGAELNETDLALLKSLATGDESGASEDDVKILLEKIGVESESEAVEFAIKSGVTWQ